MNGAQEGGPHLVHEAHDDGGGREVVMDPLLGAPATAAQLLCPERLRAEHCCEMRREGEAGNVEHGGSARHGAGSGEQGAALRGRDAPTLSFPQGPLFSSPPPGDNISFL